MDPRDHLDHDDLDRNHPADVAADRLAGDVSADLVATDGTIVVNAERLVGGTETVEYARVRLTRRIVREERTITVPVEREELVVEYLDDVVPSKGHTPVRGTTDVVASHVVEEYVLHESVPRVVFDVIPRERVKVIVDRQQAVVEMTDQVRREHVEVVGHDGIDHVVTEQHHR